MDEKNFSRLHSCCISHEFYKSASKNPNKIAVIHASPRHHAKRTKFATEIDRFIDHHPHPPVYEDDLSFTYSEILEAVDSLSRRLRFILNGGDDPSLIRSSSGPLSIDQSANAPRIVGIYMVPSVEYIISVLSVMRCEEAFMPLDPSWPKERVLSVVSSSAVNLILCDSILSDGNCSHQIKRNHWLIDSGGCSILVFSMKTNLNKHLAHPSLLWPCGNMRLRSFCYLMYTSGSTGKPKGVCGTEQGFVDHLQEILGALLTSCTLVIPSFRELKENILSMTEYLQDYSINRLVAVPSLMRKLIPTLQSSSIMMIQNSLKLLILSGEILHLSLWNSLTKLLPDTAILNLYGSTELDDLAYLNLCIYFISSNAFKFQSKVSGDCTYFDCKRLSSIIETESLSTVPIGIPIPNCEVMLFGENAPNYGEIYVSGLCIATGYFNHDIMPLNTVKKLPESSFCCSVNEKESQLYFKTGDFAKQLPGGDLVFIGRNDRTVKVNGNRMALEEIENTIRTHEVVADAAVILKHAEGELAYLEAYIVKKSEHDSVKSLSFSLRGWLVDKLPLAMIPNRFSFVDSLPMSSSGKVDYKSLASLRCSVTDIVSESEQIPHGNLLQTVKEAFCDALVVENINNNDDFFTMGGDSISAAHTCHKLGINMKLLYTFPTPIKLVTALLDPKIRVPTRLDMEAFEGGPQLPKGTDLKTDKPHGRLSSKLGDPDAESENHPHKIFKLHDDLNVNNIVSFAISRCNKVMFGENHNVSKSFQETWFGEPKGSIRELWKAHMESCVDASPLIVVRENGIGLVLWETGGEVKSQPVVDKQRHLVWCGSYDHSLYALNYQSYCCVYKLDCRGSIYGSPAINEVDERLYFASTNGCMTALSLKAVPFSVLWMQDLGAPIFGSLSINHNNGNVICCLVNGHIVAVDDTGNLVWKHDLQDPISSSAYIDENLQGHSDRLMCVCSSSGSIVVLRIKLLDNSVEEFGRLDMEGGIFSSPVMIGGRIFVGCRDDYLHCLGIQ
ncbi:hypothetical protein L1987_83620 [Smallanthus sonchifolius]|uniref:Uncharacterized protein n=1 Tax=Smallanthus sonchifolius TaxID=185202 RepID=A0ACB8YGN3_9ASTR|nr:hypothetical protein L1987_83620 [Smallanthus sonchifolius]